MQLLKLKGRLIAAAVFLVIGLLLAVAISGSLNSVALGDDLAASLGTSVVRVRVLGLVSVTLLVIETVSYRHR